MLPSHNTAIERDRVGHRAQHVTTTGGPGPPDTCFAKSTRGGTRAPHNVLPIPLPNDAALPFPFPSETHAVESCRGMVFFGAHV